MSTVATPLPSFGADENQPNNVGTGATTPTPMGPQECPWAPKRRRRSRSQPNTSDNVRRTLQL